MEGKQGTDAGLGPKVSDCQHRAWVLPPGCSIRAVVMRELVGYDEVRAAEYVELEPAATNMVTALTLGQNADIKVSIVKFATRFGDDGAPVWEDVEHPWGGFALWNRKTWVMLGQFYEELNTLDLDAQGKARASSVAFNPNGTTKLADVFATAEPTGDGEPKNG